MRIRKGSQVEVWTQEAASPVGAWRGGEVQWGNGHSYILRWQDGGPDSGRISRKSVRPRPPPAPVPVDLDAGDMVEVFDEEDSLWKCAEVERARVDGGRQFRVKVVGAPKTLTVAPNSLRLRQMLRDDDVWVLLHKDNQIDGPGATPLRVNGNGYGRHYKPVAQGFNPRKQKRAPSMFDADAITNGQRFEDTCKKKLCVREEPRDDNIEVIEVPKVLLNKQDDIDSSSSSTSSSNSSSSSSEDCDVVGTGSNSDHDDDRHQQPMKQHDNDKNDDGDSESVSSSDGSSSSDDSSGNSGSRTRSDDAGDRASAAPTSAPSDDDHHQKADLLQQFREKDDHRDDDVDVFCGSLGRPPLNEEKAVVQDPIHRLELEAYTALTRAFRASGDALSWEKAELLTDLRAQLHISNDEHLQVINAVSNRNGRRFGRPGNY